MAGVKGALKSFKQNFKKCYWTIGLRNILLTDSMKAGVRWLSLEFMR